jgi:hypothetical protein
MANASKTIKTNQLETRLMTGKIQLSNSESTRKYNIPKNSEIKK